MIDLPGAYSLVPTTLDEAITRDVVTGRLHGETPPEMIVCVLDATNLRLSLRLALELTRLSIPMIVALNMSDLAAAPRLQARLRRAGARTRCAGGAHGRGTPRRRGARWSPRSMSCESRLRARRSRCRPTAMSSSRRPSAHVRRILTLAGYVEPLRDRALARLDAIVMHPLAGPVLLALLMFLMFQAVFSWAQAPVAWINAGMQALGCSGCSS